MQARLSRRHFLAGGSVLALAGCGLPRGAPSRSEVIKGAATDDAGFALEIVTRERLPLYPAWSGRDRYQQTPWPRGGARPADQRIAAGDRLVLRVWDAEETSLLSGGAAPFADVGTVTVTSSGNVNIPYIDSVPVAGLTVEAARNLLQERLAVISPSAQVQLEYTAGRQNSVEMVGGVASPGTYPLAERNLPLSSMIAAAGGVSTSLSNPQVQITRGSQVLRRSLAFIMEHPEHDPPVQGGDRILISADRRSFKALGAAGKEEVIAFDAETVSALRAISMMGGLADSRADPRGILVLRNYRNTTQKHPFGPEIDRIVFSFDLTSANGMFDADEFALQDGDIVMATQAVATTTERVIGLFGSSLGVIRTGTRIAADL